ncbi:MAG: sigma-54-dependent Fis family transcriptional regulator [Candidatus Acididesulfobacter diazotrophicus]|jgi:two-component system nitrogen regulation response regulator NtrX|uniref:Sigma-54-dependent Fis family transcriptional regulator n=1 Tax=Candidatus Acididesulfobacter diazotrophicus TaxID=2597226 RepID=A0A519BP69_9DELT|nr:MAG: sigma-54-dependent Fis family transcriptional regulator [Candidatus Acididesulfobacter diazotrophicus]
MKSILIIDDEESIRKSLEGIFIDEGYSVISEEFGEEGLKIFSEKLPNAVLLDIWLPDSDGINILNSMAKINKNIPVIMISGHSDIDTAIKTIKMGAYDFIEKPLSLDRVLITVENALKFNELNEKKITLAQSTLRYEDELIGNSDKIKDLKNRILKAAVSDAPILITGENGTGKELVAKSLHFNSSRREEPFIAINCAAVPEDLIESELFGHEKGAFTGALARKKGKFELADGGTLFLDEIGDMSLRMQSKILRVLQDNRFQRVGGESTVEVNARIIAATNKSLEDEIKKGNFRSDLFFRLNVIPFFISPLRERKEDIPVLVDYFIDKFNLGNKQKLYITIEDNAMELFKNYLWMGNVRELKNIIERFAIMHYGSKITKQDVADELKIGIEECGNNNEDNNGDDRINSKLESNISVYQDNKTISKYIDINSLRKAKEAFERDYIILKLKENNFNISNTAKKIGMSRRNLHNRIILLNIDSHIHNINAEIKE